MTEVPGSGQSPRGNDRPVEAEQQTSRGAAPATPGSSPSLPDIDAAIGALRTPDAQAGADPTAAPSAAWLDQLELRSPDPAVCPFLRAVDEEQTLAIPIAAPDPLNRCAALHDAIPQSLRQQELVCLTSGHVNCPRYLRGAMAVSDERARRRPIALPVVRRPTVGRPAISQPILAATLVLLAAFTASVAFAVARGGITMPVAAVEATSSPAVLALAPTPEASPTPIPQPTPDPTPMPQPSPTPQPTPTPSPTPKSTLAPSPTPKPKPKPAGDPILARFPELRRCPGQAQCYIYVVQPGNNLYSIARYYRVSYERVLQMNTWITNPANIHVGDALRLPTPQRPAP